jgi:hypothetical protein
VTTTHIERLSLVLPCLLFCAVGIVLPAENVPTNETPRKSTLEENAERRLVQLDATLQGSKEALEAITVEDFQLIVGGEFIEDFTIDRICGEPTLVPREALSPGTIANTEEPIPFVGPTPTYLLYFDQPHLTQNGRRNSLRMARELLPDLIQGGAHASVVSNSRMLTTYINHSQDLDALLNSIETLDDDRDQWDPFSIREESRLGEVLELIPKDINKALQLANTYAREERWRSDRALRRFAMVLGRFADMDPPKVVLYFADTVRSNPGEHYLSLFNQARLRTLSEGGQGPGSHIESGAFKGALPFQRVIDEAAANGIRLYTVEPQGLVNSVIGTQASATFRSRIRDAETSLIGLAQETGGRAFIGGGAEARRIKKAIREDLQCVTLISFDPGRLVEDAPLPVRLRVLNPDITARLRGTIVIQSEKARKVSRLMAAFGAPAAVRDVGVSVESFAIPTGFRDGRFIGLAQVQLPGSPFPRAEWDVGATWIGKNRDLKEDSGRVSVEDSGVPIVFETEVETKPGDFSMVAVAHEQKSDSVVSRELTGTWPNPSAAPVTALPPAILQSTSAVFLRDGEARREGAAIVSPSREIDPARATAFVGLICWDRAQKKPLQVQRSLSGDGETKFPELTLDTRDGRCASYRDLVKPDTLGPGAFIYRVRVLNRKGEIAMIEREFFASESKP